LIGALPQHLSSAPPITSAPLVLFVYLVLILMLIAAMASVLLRNTLWAIGSFALSMALLALLYLTIAPLLLFAVQLVIYTTVSGGLLLGLLRLTSGLERPPLSLFTRRWIVGGAVASALGALLVLIATATSWPLGPDEIQKGPFIVSHTFSWTLMNTYVIGLGMLTVLIASAALGSGLLLVAPTLPSPRGGGPTAPRPPRGGAERSGRR
jgi:NADH:ubiquinone oxidoreductase subunit 6 (subunit J)